MAGDQACRGGARRRRARPGATHVASNACSTVTACSGCHGGALVDRPADAGADAGERVELLDRRVASRSRRRRPSRAATGTRRRRRSSRPRTARRGRGRTARARTAPSRRRRAAANRGRSSGASSCACSIRWRSPSGSHTSRVCSNASSASRFARSPIACTATGQPAAAPRADDLRELLAARDLHAGAVEHPRRLRAERPVHEHLQVAEPQERAAEARSAARSRAASPTLVVRERLPDAQRQRAALLEPPPEPRARRASRPCRAPRSRRATSRAGARRASRRRTRRRARTR